MSLQKRAYEEVFGKGSMKGRISVPMPFFTDSEISKLDSLWKDETMPILLQNVKGSIDVATARRAQVNEAGDRFVFNVARTEI
jgi:hypothetical protein